MLVALALLMVWTGHCEVFRLLLRERATRVLLIRIMCLENVVRLNCAVYKPTTGQNLIFNVHRLTTEPFSSAQGGMPIRCQLLFFVERLESF